MNEANYKKAHQTSARYPANISEFDATGLTPDIREGFPAPFVKESQVQFSLVLKEKINLALNGTILIIGQIQEVWIPDNILQADGFLDLEGAGSLTCSGLDSYHSTKRLARLSYAKPDQPIEVIPVK